jgi:excisionase family DNA binding protein
MNAASIPPAQRLQVRPREAAELLSISERALRRLTQLGEIPSIGTGRLRRYAVEDLRAYQQRNRTGGEVG